MKIRSAYKVRDGPACCFYWSVCTEAVATLTLVPATAAGGGQRGSGKWGGGVVRGAGWLGRWDGGALAAAASPGRLLHLTPVLIPTSSSTHASKPLVQYLIFKITDDKKWIEIEEKGETGTRTLTLTSPAPAQPSPEPRHLCSPLSLTRTRRLLRRLQKQAAGQRLPLRRPRRGDRDQVRRHRQQAPLHRLVGRQRHNQAEDALRVVQGRHQEGARWHQRRVPGN